MSDSMQELKDIMARAGVDTQQIDTVMNMLQDKTRYPNVAQSEPDPEGQEKLEPRAPAEKAWANRHTVSSFERADDAHQDGADRMEMADAPTAPTSPAKPETTVSFNRIRQMMSS